MAPKVNVIVLKIKWAKMGIQRIGPLKLSCFYFLRCPDYNSVKCLHTNKYMTLCQVPLSNTVFGEGIQADLLKKVSFWHGQIHLLGFMGLIHTIFFYQIAWSMQSPKVEHIRRLVKVKRKKMPTTKTSKSF